jgi:hypothetical protein
MLQQQLTRGFSFLLSEISNIRIAKVEEHDTILCNSQ